jgi:heme/copper-type cytochrome/quinol oxidase subunit 2
MTTNIKKKLFLVLIGALLSLVQSTLSYEDAPRPWQMNFQQPATPTMEGIIDLHHNIMFFMIFVLIFVSYVLIRSVYLFNSDNMDLLTPVSRTRHYLSLEVVWTILPLVILYLIALPSFALLYSIDHCSKIELTVKIIGRQWYWSYEIDAFLKYTFSSKPIDKFFLGVLDNIAEAEYNLRVWPAFDEAVESVHTNMHKTFYGTDLNNEYINFAASWMYGVLLRSVYEIFTPTKEFILNMEVVINQIYDAEDYNNNSIKELLPKYSDVFETSPIGTIYMRPKGDDEDYTLEELTEFQKILILTASLKEFLLPLRFENKNVFEFWTFENWSAMSAGYLTTPMYIWSNLISKFVRNYFLDLGFAGNNLPQRESVCDVSEKVEANPQLTQKEIDALYDSIKANKDIEESISILCAMPFNGIMIIENQKKFDDSFCCFDYDLGELVLNDWEEHGLLQMAWSILVRSIVKLEKHKLTTRFNAYDEFIFYVNLNKEAIFERPPKDSSNYGYSLRDTYLGYVTIQEAWQKFRKAKPDIEAGEEPFHYLLEFDSCIVSDNEVFKNWWRVFWYRTRHRLRLSKLSTDFCGWIRLLEVDKRLVLPIKTKIRLLVTSSDVIHSWAVPSLGVKIDACPGRLNCVYIYIKRPGVFHGQCSELCGVKHGFMPIVVHAVTKTKYNRWYAKHCELLNHLRTS